MKLPGAEKIRIIPLPQYFVDADCHRIREVQAARVRIVQHGNADAVIRVLKEQFFRQSGGLLAKHQITAVRIGDVGMHMPRLCRKIVEIAAVLPEKIGKTIVIGDVQKMPVIQARALELPVVDFKPHRPDQVKPGAGGRAGAGDISGVLRDFRFHQYNVECCHVFHSPPGHARFQFC